MLKYPHKIPLFHHRITYGWWKITMNLHESPPFKVYICVSGRRSGSVRWKTWSQGSLRRVFSTYFSPFFRMCLWWSFLYIYTYTYAYGFSIRTFGDPWGLFMWSFVNLSAFEVFSSRIFQTFCISNQPASCETLRPVLPARWSYGDTLHVTDFPDVGMDQYLLIPFLGGRTSIYQLFWCSPVVQGFDMFWHTAMLPRSMGIWA